MCRLAFWFLAGNVLVMYDLLSSQNNVIDLTSRSLRAMLYQFAILMFAAIFIL